MEKSFSISALFLVMAFMAVLPNNLKGQILLTNSKPKNVVEVIQKSIKAMDPNQRISGFNLIRVSWTGTRDWGPTLSHNIDRPNPLTFVENKAYMDFKNKRSIKESSWQYHGEEPETIKHIQINNDYLWTYGRQGMGDYKEDQLPFNSDFYAVAGQYFLPSFLLHLIENESIKLSIDSLLTQNSNQFIVVKVTKENGSTYNLFLDGLSLFPVRLERLHQDALFGTVMLREHFYDYKKIDEVYLPTIRVQSVAERITIQQKGTYSFNSSIDEKAFELPKKYVKSDLGVEIEPSLEKISKGIYLAKIRYNQYMVFVEFKDYAMAFFAPWNAATTKVGVELFLEEVKNKPIKYVGLVSHWWDQSGGVREFIARDTEIITTSKEVPYYTMMANATYSISPDTLSFVSKKPKFKAIKGRESISDGKRELEIIYMPETNGDNPYIFYYLPNEQILISSSGFEATFDSEGGIRAASDATARLVKILEDKDLKVKILFNVNGGVGTWDQLMSSMSLRSKE
jgi:hypothetical protein